MSKDEELSVIKYYRETHHAVARLLAAGASETIIQRQTGLTMRRVAMLTASPSFQALIEIYRRQVAEKWEQNVDAYLDLGMANMIRAEMQIRERLEAADDEGADPISLPILDRISQGRADRFGYSKHTVHHHEHDFAQALDRAIERSGKDPRVVEASVVSQLPSPLAALEAPALVATEPEQGPRTRGRKPGPYPSIAAALNPLRRRRVA